MIARLVALLLALLPIAAAAQAPGVTADPILLRRADALVGILATGGDYDRYFAESFRTKVPREQLATLAGQLRAALGAPQTVESLKATTAWSADLVIGYERGTAAVTLALDPAAPHLATGLLVTGTGMRDDTLDKVTAAFRALPGASGFGLYALGEAAPTPIAGYRADAAAPIGSAFKLWVLDETARQVAAGTRHWAEVVPLGTRSLPSGVLQGWPAGTPVTLQTLATMMVSISDNTATDTLMAVLGRAAIDARAVANGGSAPVLTTREAFAVKSDPALTTAWTAATPPARRALLESRKAEIAAAPLDASVFGGKPVAIDSVEWFASPLAMAGVLDRLRKADNPVRAILGVNAGVDSATAGRFRYIGYKGGSEPGVIALNFVVQARDGRWYAATGNWHRADDQVSELRFSGLMTRLLALVAAR
ncbi:serine hydrolase [Sphingomonas ginsenosidivorax]|uniref:serine hydrolase n=1 Tax=Sphingomonas ginsenosidivorax TaxID=862135 RepID=UPI001F549FB0|nr:serine hydrolase [Sphingomonas ginsenosidivorax]